MPDTTTTTPATPPAGEAVSELRLVLTVDDHARAVAFYRDRLGLTELEAHDGHGGHVTILGAGRATLEINDEPYAAFIDEVEVGRRVPGRVRVAFRVPDSDAATEELVEAGARLVSLPTPTPWDSRNARLRDPDGLQLTLFTEPAATRDP